MIDPGEYVLTILKPGYPQITEEIIAKKGSNQYKINFSQVNYSDDPVQINNKYDIVKNSSKAMLSISKDHQIDSEDFIPNQIVKPNKFLEKDIQESSKNFHVKSERAKSGTHSHKNFDTITIPNSIIKKK